MIVIHTDASTKQGYSCWAYKSSIDDKFHAGIVHTTNSAAVETLAAVRAIQSVPKGEKILIISDSLITVRIIQQYGTDYIYNTNAKDYYRQVRTQLVHILYNRNVDAVWVASNNPNNTHLEVDNTAKTVLDYYLRGIK
jgi:predicted DCC family thiol-disulfide oxidoreductase YuxK